MNLTHLGSVLFGAWVVLAGCSGSSKSNTPSTGGTASTAGRGGASAGGSAGTSSTAGQSPSAGTGGGGAGAGGASAGTAGETGTGGTAAGAGGSTAGNGGAGTSSGGAAGSDPSDAGESSGGSGGTCQDLCTEEAPACCTEPLRCVESIPTCRIDIFAEFVSLPFDYEELEAEIATLTGGIEISIPSAEVEWAAADTPPSPRFEFRLTAEASVTHTALKELYETRPFRFSCNDQELFVGVTYMLIGAAGIRTPVLHIEETETGAIRLLLGSWQGAWGLSSSTGDVTLRERIDRPELRAAYCGRGILNEL